MLWMLYIGIILKIFILFKFVQSNKIPNTKLHSILLDHQHVKLSWLIDWKQEQVMFNVDNAFDRDTEWFSFGFSPRGKLENADICYFVKDNNIFGYSIDTHVNTDGKIYEDIQQNCEILRIDDESVAFKHKFDTCDPQDFPMHEGTMYIVWEKGNRELNFPLQPTSRASMSSLMHSHKHQQESGHSVKKSGIVPVQLLRSDKLIIPEKNVRDVEIKLHNVRVPAQETTYWCYIKKLDDFIRDKHHIVQFEPKVTSTEVVHHMEVFHCDTGPDVEIPLYNGDCDELPVAAKVCSKVISLWAMGASTFTYPIEAGLPIGGENYNPFIRLEVHFNNPDLIDGIIDSSGFNIKVTSTLRKYDAAIMELGLEYTDKMAIPPGVVAFPLSGYCISECTKIALPESGITIFGSQLHAHLRGIRILTRHFRGTEELREVNRDDYFNPDFQDIRYLRYQAKVLPGDALVTTCYYDTEKYTNTTLGGFSISDEMCVNYIQYYPATILELCKSAVAENVLQSYFEYMKNKEHQNHIILNGGARSDNYRSIEWTDERISELHMMYIHEPLSMQCNRSDGQRYDGFNWEGAPITQVPILQEYPEKCKNYDPFGINPLVRTRCGMLGDCIY